MEIRLNINPVVAEESRSEVRLLMKMVGISEAAPWAPVAGFQRGTPQDIEEGLLDLIEVVKHFTDPSYTPGSPKIRGIKAIRKMTGLGLNESKAIYERVFGPAARARWVFERVFEK